ncbi:MAG: hypothetical protein CM15mV144_490 [Caudoviricetes sp.]|nr:MAG: hypothetical protein CM15mV144_490 [Caudoviricetes sp.]
MSMLLQAKTRQKNLAIKGVAPWQSDSQPPHPVRKTKSTAIPSGNRRGKRPIFSWLNVDEVKNGYIHFPILLMRNFKQLTAEKRVVKYYKGQKRLRETNS